MDNPTHNTNHNVHSFQSAESLRAEARAWVLTFNADKPPSEQDIAGLREWVARSQAHREALKRAEKFWCDADSLAELAVPLGRFKKQRFDFFGRRKHPRRPDYHRSAFGLMLGGGGLLGRHRMGALAACAAFALVAVLSLVYAPYYGTVGNGTYITAIGEQRTLTLRDQSQVQLDTNSEVRIVYSDGHRQMQLLKGRAHFDVAKNPERPFEVFAGAGMVRAVGTAFSVYLDRQDIEVIVDEGRVEVARVEAAALTLADAATLTDAPTGNRPETSIDRANANVKRLPQPRADARAGAADSKVFLSLSEGQAATFNEREQSLTQLKRSELARQHAWRRGLLIFNDDSLSTVVEQIGRYTPVSIEITDPLLKDLKLGGRFKAGELDALFDVLEVGFGIQVSVIDEATVQLHSAQ